ncbi:MAG: peptide ABC transporter substrate-binding protein, partial [Gammaproteobacteria bacterium]
SGCEGTSWNNPYPVADRGSNTLYASFTERPKHLDPARSYSANEYTFIAQIYEPPLQYHYLKRPYRLVPLTAERVPHPTYLDRAGRPLDEDAPVADIAYSVYEIRIRPGIRYQPHPAFAKHNGVYRYHRMTPAELRDRHRLADFPYDGTRELTAADYVYQIKRLAHPAYQSPIAGLMGNYIQGLREYGETLRKTVAAANEAGGGTELALRDLPLAGAQVVDRYTYRIIIIGKYPQFVYWLAMPFFAPMPWEAERFYSQPGMKERNISLDWYPVGTGPYMLAENNPNRRMVLDRNPNFRGEAYPEGGMAEDKENGLLADAGRPMPFIDRAVYSLEKESIPYWNKFLQGYYDTSGVNSDSFDQAIQFNQQGDPGVSAVMRAKAIKLRTAVTTSSYYMGFNMLDPVVGGYSERARNLRRAIAIAVDYEEYISIFANGRGLPAQGPIQPGIFGNRRGEAGHNPYVYDWRRGGAGRKSLDQARRLLSAAGYPGGREAISGAPLVLNFDTPITGPDGKARLDWMRKQFAKLDIQLVVRATDYNRFQDKMRKGGAQIFQWGWNADYPDPENFLFLLYGPNGKVKHQGENAANYHNDEYDTLFVQMKDLGNGPERQRVIDRMVEILRRDAPWLWGFHPKSFSLQHAWYQNLKPNLMANNTLKYVRLDPEHRAQRRAEWNRPVLWPLGLALSVLVLVLSPAVLAYRRRERTAGR